MNPIELINLHQKEYTKSEEKIKNYILDNLDIISSFPIVEVSSFIGVSKSALLRFCKKIGYDGYSEFKYEVSRMLISGVTNDDSLKSNEDIIKIYQMTIDKIPDFISNDSILTFISHILNANKLKIYGIHETGLSAQYFSFRLAALGIDSEVITLPSVIHEKANFSKSDDLNIFLSLSATSDCIVDAVNTSAKKKASTVLITQNNKSHLLKQCDDYILIPSLNFEKNRLFLDSQIIIFLCINLIINQLAISIKKKESAK